MVSRLDRRELSCIVAQVFPEVSEVPVQSPGTDVDTRVLDCPEYLWGEFYPLYLLSSET